MTNQVNIEPIKTWASEKHDQLELELDETIAIYT